MRIKTILLSFILFSTPLLLLAQIGIGTDVPNATLEVIGKPDMISIPDGIIAPKFTRAELIAKAAYSSDQIGSIVYVTDLSGIINTATILVKEIGYYYFNGTVWNSMNADPVKTISGDIKTGIQPTDHNGWIKLDGRAKSTLTTSQQIQATSLGIGANLPDATNAFLVQNEYALGSVSGSNTKILTQSNLPNVNLSTQSAGIHQHAIGVADSNTYIGGGYANNLPTAFKYFMGPTNINDAATTDRGITGTATTSIIQSDGAHTHIVPLNGGVTQESFDITPRSLTINTFIYLGE